MSFNTPDATSAATLRGPQPVAARSALLGSTYAGFHPMARGPMVTFAPATDTGADEGPLSVDDAVSLLTAVDEEAEAPPDPENAATSAAEEAAADDEDEASDQEAVEDDAPDEDDPASEDEPDEDEEAEPAEPAIDAPRFWSAEEKAVFAKAPPDVQLLIAAKDQAAEKRVYEAKEEAAAARKDASVIGEFKAVIDQQVERAQTIFQGKWDGVDWAQWARENPQEAFQAKIEHDQEAEELAKLQTAQTATAAEEHRQFLKDEAAKLRDAGHVLADREKGGAEKQKLVAYAKTAGVTAESLQWASALELTILHKAMLWDAAQANVAARPVKPAPTKKPDPAPAAKAAGPVRPAAAAPPRKSVAMRQRQEVVGKAMKTGRMDDAVVALLALEGKR